MIQLTIDNATMQIPNPKSEITNPRPGRVFHLSHASHLFAMFPMFLMFPMFPLFPLFAVFPRTPDARKKQNAKKCGMQCRRLARQQGLIFEFGTLASRNTKPSTTPSAEAASTAPYQGGELSEFGILESQSQTGRFSCFNCFRHFISFMRFNRFNTWPL